MHFADRLRKAIQEKNVPACVGLDPLLERLPPAVLAAHGVDTRVQSSINLESATQAIIAFGSAIIELVAPYVPAIKINIAFFEPFYEHGIGAYHQLVARARGAGLVVIGDVKRADIGHTSRQYARAQLGDSNTVDIVPLPDAVTVNPYFGSDGVSPFVELANQQHRGVFVLVQTSNASAAQVQGLILPDGDTLCQKVARLVETWARDTGQIGDCGFSNVGAVVSPRDLPSTHKLRELMPHCLFLVPGFGAQGRTADEVKACFKADGSGAIVTASRSVIYAHSLEQYSADCGGDWKRCVDLACRNLVDQIRGVTVE